MNNQEIRSLRYVQNIQNLPFLNYYINWHILVVKLILHHENMQVVEVQHVEESIE